MKPLKVCTKPSIRLPFPRNPADDLLEFQPDMLRFARLQLRDDAAAEDAVQEALASALDKLPEFKGLSQLKTWVFSILKNKIIDVIRSRVRSAPAEDILVDELSADDQFDDQGSWQVETKPSDWGNPEQSFENKQFWQVFDLCLSRLPINTARVFMMREMLGLNTEEICKELAACRT